MSRSSRSSRPTPARTQPADPLADLREQVPTPTAPEQSTPTAPEQPTPEGESDLSTSSVIYDQAWHDAAAAQVVNRWHGDRVASAYAHKGGTCGCRYLASMALVEVLGAALPEAQPEQPEDEQQAGGDSE